MASAPLLELDAAVAWRETERSAGRTVVFTNGVFDLVHAGHVAYLEWARAQGSALIVGLNADVSVRALKGPERPLVMFADRAAVLERIVVLRNGGEIRLAPHQAGKSTTDIVAEIRNRYGA